MSWDLAAEVRFKVGYALTSKPACRVRYEMTLSVIRADVQDGRRPYLAAGLTCKVADVLIWQPG